MVDPPKPISIHSPVHSSQNTYAARDLVTQINGTPKDIPIGALLEGKVISQSPSGLTTLQTSHGDITFQTQIGLLRGSLVTLRVTATSNDFQARLVTINGLNLQEYLGGRGGVSDHSARVTTPFTLPQDEVVQPSADSNTRALLQQGEQGKAGASVATEVADSVLRRNSLLQITLLSPDKAGIAKILEALPPAVREQLLSTLQISLDKGNTQITPRVAQEVLARVGNILDFKVLNYQLPTAATPTTTTGAQINANVPSSQAPTVSPYQAGNATTPNASQQGYQNSGGTQVNSASVANSAAGFGANAPTTSGLSPQVADALSQNLTITTNPKTGNVSVQALVIGREPNGQTVLKTPLGIFHTSAALTKGTVLELEPLAIAYVASSTSGLTSSTQTSNTQDAFGKLLSFWKSFGSSEMLQLMQDTGKTQALISRFPNADTNLGANLLRYFSALGKADAPSLLGRQLTSHLERTASGKEQLEQLGRDLGVNRQLFQQSQYDWKTLIFPVVSDDVWYANRLMLKEYEGENEQEEREHGVRFVIELDMEKLGALQLDGLVRSTQKKQFFDLTIRSQQPIPDGMKQGILTIFHEAQEDLGVEGQLAFQTVHQLPNITHEASAVGVDSAGKDDSIIV